MAQRSTRVGIVEQALEEVTDRLEALAPSPQKEKWAARAAVLLQRLEKAEQSADADRERAALVNEVLELAVEIMDANRK
jgi:hypothetical protein